MKKIGITGSLASGKSTAAKIISATNGPLFVADKVVKNIYKKNSFIKLISRKFKIKNLNKIKIFLKDKILEDKSNLKKLEKIIHPLVRKEMRNFSQKNKKKNLLFMKYHF